ncbi:phosphatidate cytidylyltransferase [Helicosporidium sp. ATCC 50920]|nr:phosphatidate cytidylyltransferase [Helicosporidium sp. ATCC 50920]|eukprot:KDD76632.1 phosphatidate cytidylyltransferase [Helicosporidium sp. ATCC 50920]
MVEKTNSLTRRHSNVATELKPSRLSSFWTRTVSTVILIGVFLGVIAAGHVPLMFMILGIQAMMVRELFALARVSQQENKLPGFRAQQWYFFGVATLWVYIRFIIHNLSVELSGHARAAHLLGWVIKHHTILCFSLYTAGFVSFVLTLKKGMYTYQFQQYGWTHMILLVIILPSSFFVSNIFDGLIWFLLPTLLVITNDIVAYLAGFFFGRTPLIKLSPKKTWEGFIGGLLGTVILSWFLAKYMSQWSWFTCPRSDLSIIQDLSCNDMPPIYTPQTYYASNVLGSLPPSVMDVVQHVLSHLPSGFQTWLRRASITACPMQFHAVSLSIFASLIAPFGGFFASGFKRGFKIKDFGDSIPGHGGMTDRMDCQVIMAIFSYLYLNTYILAGGPSVGSVLAAAVRLSPEHQLEAFARFANVLVGAKLLPPAVADAIAAHAQRHAQVQRAAMGLKA